MLYRWRGVTVRAIKTVHGKHQRPLLLMGICSDERTFEEGSPKVLNPKDTLKYQA
jgi:hypothetical protein